jgi:hypothetical protein
VDQCWQICLKALERDWKTDLKRSRNSYPFVYNWIEGKSEISEQTLHSVLKNGSSLEMSPEDEERFLEISDKNRYHPRVPHFWAFQPDQDIMAFTRSINKGDASFFNTKTGQFLGEILGGWFDKLLFDQEIKPIFYKNDIIILFQGGSAEIRIYEIKEKILAIKQKIILNIQDRIVSMNLFKDYLMFQTEGMYYEIKALSLKHMKKSKTPTLISPKFTWTSELTLEVFREKIVLLRETSNGFTCRTLCIKKGKIKLSRHIVENEAFLPHNLKNGQTFYHTDRYAFFLFSYTGKDHIVRAISKEPLQSKTPLSFASSPPQEGFGKLVLYKNSMILCSGLPGSSLKFQTLDVIEGKVEINPLVIQGSEDYKFDSITCAYVHLDKLFLIGIRDAVITRFNQYLVIVDMQTCCMEKEFQLLLDKDPKILAISPGILCIFNPSMQTIIQIQY